MCVHVYENAPHIDHTFLRCVAVVFVYGACFAVNSAAIYLKNNNNRSVGSVVGIFPECIESK